MSSLDEHASRLRSGRFRRNAAALVSARGVTVVLAFAQVAIALPYLGESRYGAWMLLQALGAAAHMGDFGIGLGTQQAMAVALARGDAAEARAVARAGTMWLGGLAFAVAILGATLAWLSPWTSWAGLTEFDEEARLTALTLAVLTAAALPLNIVPRLAAAAQLQWVQAAWAVVGSAATLAWVATAAVTGIGLVGIATGAALIAILQNVGMAVQTLRQLGWQPFRWERLAVSRRQALGQSCLGYAVPQFGQALVQSAPSAALSLAGGPAAVTAFTLVQRLLTPFTQAQGLILASLMPGYTEAATRGESVWVQRKFRQSLAGSAGLIVVLAGITSLAPWIVPLWTRQALPLVEPALLWLTAAWCAALVAVQPLTTLLTGLGHWRALAVASAWGYPLATVAFFAGAWIGPAASLLAGTGMLLAVLGSLLARRTSACLRELAPRLSP